MKQSDGHDWTKRDQWTVCKKCGIIKRKDGKNKQCRGIVKITTRTTKAALVQQIANLLTEIEVLAKDRDEGWKRFREYRKLYAELKYPKLTGTIVLASGDKEKGR